VSEDTRRTSRTSSAAAGRRDAKAAGGAGVGSPDPAFSSKVPDRVARCSREDGEDDEGWRRRNGLGRALIAGTQILYEPLEFGDLAFEFGDSLFVGLKSPAVCVDFVQGGFVLNPADVQDVAG
jgi:hypothetical protein